MDRNVKERWVAALRSGDFRQGRIRLVRGHRGSDTELEHCCLGVLCEVLGYERVSADGIGPSNGGPNLGYRAPIEDVGDQAGGDRPYSGVIKYSLDAKTLADAGIDPEDEGDLIGMNDASDNTFADIARHIEENL